jgi:bifunctional NMN adenylyltransferase/nudix hydrolase
MVSYQFFEELEMKKLKVFIGRLSPFHLGHAEVLKRAIATSDHVLLLIGSSAQARTIKNPFTFQERRHAVLEWLFETMSPLQAELKVTIKPLYDYPYNNSAWIKEVQEATEATKRHMLELSGTFDDVQCYITGSDRDKSTWYLHAFGNYFKEDLVDPKRLLGELTATRVRDSLFGGELSDIESLIPPTTMRFLQEFKTTPAYYDLVAEYTSNLQQRESWALPERELFKKDFSQIISRFSGPEEDKAKLQLMFNRMIKLAPYPSTFTTVDAVVIQSGHILVNVRDDFPGRGLWALPGGFVEQSEWLIDACIRELQEETRIELAPAQLYGSIKHHQVFDFPERSTRGRTFTHAYLLKLDDTKPLPKVKPQKGEVKSVQFIPINEALSRTDRWFEDHHHIAQTMYNHSK